MNEFWLWGAAFLLIGFVLVVAAAKQIGKPWPFYEGRSRSIESYRSGLLSPYRACKSCYEFLLKKKVSGT